MNGYRHPYDRANLVVGSTQRWRPNNADATLIGRTSIFVSGDSAPTGAMAKIASWDPSQALGIGLVLGAFLGAVGCYYGMKS